MAITPAQKLTEDDNSKTQEISLSLIYSILLKSSSILLKSDLNQAYINVLLPTLIKSINSPLVTFHCMKIVMGLINHLNFRQTMVMIADQPVYAIAKRLQWCYSDKCKAGSQWQICFIFFDSYSANIQNINITTFKINVNI